MVRVAVEGCCHGMLNSIYEALPKVDFLIICGDFQALRNETDLETINVPRKYLQMGDFHQYYLGEKTAPVLTIFIGGNHECLLYLRELQYGGWVAPNIYYLGEYGVVWYKGLRISGTSGIWNFRSFVEATEKPPSYALPYSFSTIKSAYHVKPKNYLKMLLTGTSDIALSHDWPQWVWHSGDSAQLLRHKPFFKDDMKSGRLGSPLAGEALAHLRPRYWFSLHLHTRFSATVRHKKQIERPDVAGPKKEAARSTAEVVLDMDDEPTETKTIGLTATETKSAGEASGVAAGATQGTDEIALDMDGEESRKRRHSLPEHPRRKASSGETQFLALDKCLPRRRFLEVIEIEPETESSDKLLYDARAIAIQVVVEKFVTTPSWKEVDARQILKVNRIRDLLAELDESVEFEMKRHTDLEVPYNFEKIAPDNTATDVPLKYWHNPQTESFCRKFGISEPVLDGP